MRRGPPSLDLRSTPLHVSCCHFLWTISNPHAPSSLRGLVAGMQVYVTSVPVPNSSEMWQHPSPDDAFTKDLAYRLASDPSPLPPPYQAGSVA